MVISKKQSISNAALITLVMLLIQISCTAKSLSDSFPKESIIRKTVSITSTGEYFTLKASTGIYIQGEFGRTENKLVNICRGQLLKNRQ